MSQTFLDPTAEGERPNEEDNLQTAAYRVGYLVNQYPAISHTFIRREIAALEELGLPIERFSIRRSAAGLIDPADRAELARTRFILPVGWGGWLGVLGAACVHPMRWLRALGLAWRMGRRSDRGVLRHLAYLAEAGVLYRWTARLKINHLHAHFGTNPAAVAWLCRELGGPSYSFTVHGPEELDRAAGLALAPKIEGAKFVAAVSHFTRSQLYHQCKVADWPKIQVIHCGLDDSFWAGPLTPVPAAGGLVCVGRLSPAKGHLLLIQAAAVLRRQGLNFNLVLVGDGPLRPQLAAEIKQQDLTDCLILTGWADNRAVRQYIRAARALVLPSLAEGLPVVIMEALALGRPVISTHLAGIPELVQPGVNGWLVPAGDVEGLALAMHEALLAPPARLTAMGQAGAERVKQQHHARLEAGKLLALFINS